ncbi:MAG: hypothetical protein AAF581_18390 [Planctomycetota bacterium]
MLNARHAAVLALGLLGLLVGCVPLHSYTALGEVEVVQSELDGTIRFSDEALPGTDIDVVDSLGIDRDEVIAAYRGAVNFGPVSVEVEYAEAEYTGDAILTEDITFLGETFTVSSDVASKLTGLMAGGKVRFGLLGVGSQEGKPGVVVGGIVGLQYMELSAELVSTSLGLRGEDTERVVFPVVGGSVRLDQPLGGNAMLFVEADASGMQVSNSDADGTFLDATLHLGLVLREVFTFGGGYRFRRVDFEIEDDEVDVDVDGPFVFAGLRF